MPVEAANLLAVGEKISYLNGLTIVEIVPLPLDKQMRNDVLSQTTVKVIKTPGLKFIVGSNLADVEELAPRVDTNVIYLFTE